MTRIASFHLISEPGWKAPQALARLGVDRRRLNSVDGLAFWRLLGTGKDDRTSAGADLARTALFAVWDDEGALDQFLGSHRIARRWHAATEHWTVRLRGLGGHGAWRGFDPMAELQAGSADGPIAVITRADVRRPAWRAFGAASRTVDTELHAAAGLIDVVGIGEAPLGRLGTFSLWDSIGDARAFAYTMPDHIEVMRRTRDENWYAEELFARFEPFASTGTWNGRDPLQGM